MSVRGWGVVVVGAAVVFVAVAFAVRLTHRGEILPRTSVAGLDVGGLPVGEARRILAARSERPLTVGGREVVPRRAGVAWDVEETLERARRRGRRGPAFGVLSTLRTLVDREDVVPVLARDERRLRATVDELAGSFDRPPDDGGFRVDPTTLEAEVRTPRPGRAVRRRELRRRLVVAIRRGRTRVAVPMVRRPALARDEVEAAARAAERYLETPVQVRAGNRTVEVAPEDLAPALAVQPIDRGRAQLALRDPEIEPVLDRLAGRFRRTPTPPRVTSVDGVVVDGKGSLAWRPRRAGVRVAGGRAGRRLDAEATRDRLARAVRSGDHRVRAVLRRVAPTLAADEARRIRWIIGTFTTRYAPGEPRVRNIRRIAAAVDGTVVRPGATFSLNGTAGRRTRDKGYVEAPFIADGKIVPSVGGGVSQFSTTMYNAAFFAGLRLDSSQPHSLYIDRYPPGREATLDFPSIDLRWTNDTNTPVVVRATSTPTSVTVALLGDNGGRRVRSITGPRRPVPGGDFAITVTREVRYPDGRVARQPRTTQYDRPVED